MMEDPAILGRKAMEDGVKWEELDAKFGEGTRQRIRSSTFTKDGAPWNRLSYNKAIGNTGAGGVGLGGGAAPMKPKQAMMESGPTRRRPGATRSNMSKPPSPRSRSPGGLRLAAAAAAKAPSRPGGHTTENHLCRL